MDQAAYRQLLRAAYRASFRPDEAQDLLQTVLMAAFEAGRDDLTDPNNRRWLMGALRKRALFDARSAGRRSRREAMTAHKQPSTPQEGLRVEELVGSLSPALRTTALLALTGHTKQEIAWLTGLTDTALRQRLTSIKRRWRDLPADAKSHDHFKLAGDLDFGQIRKHLLPMTQANRVVLGSHDPDGHLFCCSITKPASAATKGTQQQE